MATRRYICLALVFIFSACGLFTSVHLAEMHYKKPKYMLNLLDTIPLLERWIDREALEEKAGGDGAESLREKLEDEDFDPYAAAFAQANDPFNNVKTEEELSGGFVKSEECDINEGFSCTKVDESKYSEIGGISVSLYGAAGYIALMLLSGIGFFTQKKRLNSGEPRRPDFAVFLLFAGCLTGFIFSLWLTYLEAYHIKSYCPYCLASAAFIALSLFAMLTGFGLSPVTNYKRKRDVK